jgi:hypothetical protein
VTWGRGERPGGLIGRRVQPEQIENAYELLAGQPGDVLGVPIEWDGA